jgi:SAM-dependent methyltransferase
MDGRALEFPDGELDAAYCSRVLIHAAEPAQVVAEMARVVKPGGRVMCIEPVVQPCTGIDDQLRRKVTAWTNPDVARALPALMRKAGLVDVTVTPHVALNAEAPNARALRSEFEAGQGRYVASVREGQCTAEDVIKLLDQMQAVADRGDFLECLVHYAVRGTKVRNSV